MLLIIRRYNTAKKLTFIVPATENIIQRRPVASFKKTNDESKSKHLGIGLCARDTEGEDGPAKFKEGDPD